MATDRKHSLIIKQRFIEAIQTLSKELYPSKKEVDIIRSLGLIPSNFYRMRKSEKNYPTLDDCYNLCTLYNVSGDWLISGIGSIHQTSGSNKTGLELIKEGVSLLEAANNAANTKVKKQPK